MTYSQTYLRDERGCYGFKCSCGFSYELLPNKDRRDSDRAQNLVDCHLRNHDEKHQRGK